MHFGPRRPPHSEQLRRPKHDVAVDGKDPNDSLVTGLVVSQQGLESHKPLGTPGFCSFS